MIKNVQKLNLTLLNADFVALNKNWNYKNVTSTFYRIYYIGEGSGNIDDAAGSIKLEPGFLYLIPSFTTCNYHCTEYMSQYYITFVEESPDGASLFAANRKIFKIPARDQEAEAVKRICKLNPGRGLKGSHNPSVFEKHAALQRYQELNQAMSAPALMETRGLLLQLMARFIASGTFNENEETAINSKIADAINFMLTNLQSGVMVTELAKRACLHPDYFSRLFHENTGERPLAYLQLRRVERARLLLTTTDLPVYEVARQSGFESTSYFARIFKNITGLTAGAYKRDNTIG
ncbi:helix-turn-helix domain-containing protein [Mucilaginibacter paludis]|uniref:Transcriptional regulator, AraC family n=1 Tax=Mucilaginibacter paludis DSM 18603 TaxID=714943 RepID=H1Y6E4_9SPHI|nr:helix-turn-helix domain-containing protein [Mucilaginibacter paludis]EHQ24892.1 transcriptional regulator, AraC family [Mucilaginibacter paludis DSM 18603]